MAKKTQKRPHYFAISSFSVNFAEDRLHLGNLKHVSLRSVCTIFAEDRLHLGNLKHASLRSVCTIFATNKALKRGAKQTSLVDNVSGKADFSLSVNISRVNEV